MIATLISCLSNLSDPDCQYVVGGSLILAGFTGGVAALLPGGFRVGWLMVMTMPQLGLYGLQMADGPSGYFTPAYSTFLATPLGAAGVSAVAMLVGIGLHRCFLRRPPR